jgi:hypothetical protein
MRRIVAVVVAFMGLALGGMVASRLIDGTFTGNLWSSVLMASCGVLLLAFAGRIALG